MLYIRFNKKYNLQIIWDGENLPILIDLTTHKEVIPFIRKSNTKLQYPCIMINGVIEYVHKIIKYSFEGYKTYKPGYVVDHINRNTFDYRPSNLRYLSRSDNAFNVGSVMDGNAVKRAKIDIREDMIKYIKVKGIA